MDPQSIACLEAVESELTHGLEEAHRKRTSNAAALLVEIVLVCTLMWAMPSMYIIVCILIVYVSLHFATIVWVFKDEIKATREIMTQVRVLRQGLILSSDNPQ